ncbi:MAG: ABC transporter substrate-binding protein [Candidatus Rokubacteria bacterium]|nr:ABC transporter substrate-binding protein [Candidatus Rokubacteria bacterium]
MRKRGARDKRQAITRRTFVELGLAAGAAALVPGGGAASAQAPRRGGVLRVAVPSAARRLDPAIHGSNDEFIISQAIFNNLVRVDAKLNPQPELASGWSVSDDGKTWTFRLRRGVKFHHGRELTSKDVEFTLKRILDPATASIGRSLFGVVQGIETPDPYTIRFALSAPYGDLPMMFGSVYARILPFDAAGEVSKTPIGTGPFKMKEFVPADHVTLVRHTEYWERDAAGNQLPYVDELRQVTIPEQAAQIAALTGGSVHILFEAASQSISTLKADPGVKVLETPSPSYHEITIWVDRPPFSDPRVMAALKHSLDRDALVKAALGGLGTPSNDNPVSPISPFWVDTGMKTRDVAKAKALMVDAGHRDGLDVELITSPDRPGLVEFAVGVKEMAAGAGFRINVKAVPWDVYTAQYNRKHPFTMQNWNGRPTIDESLYPYYHSRGSYKELYHFSNPEMDRLLDDGRREADPRKRKNIYGRVQRILVDSGPTVIPYHRPYVMAIHRRVQGYEIHPIRWVDVRRTWLG